MSQSAFNGAAASVAAPIPRRKKKKWNFVPGAVVLGYVERDFRQSYLDLDAKTANVHSMRAIPSINALKGSGGLFYDIYETGGGTVEGDYLRGRFHVRPLRRIRKRLSHDIGMRPLKRGVYVVGRYRRHPQDIALANAILSRAVGSDEGKPELEKIFDAQDLPEKILPALREAQERFDKGFSNGVEIGICFSARARFTDAYYHERMDALVAMCEGFTCVKAIGPKDTVGYMRGRVDEKGRPLKLCEGNSAMIYDAIADRVEKLHKKQGYGPGTITGHTHDSGFANEAAAAMIAAHYQRRSNVIKQIRMDELPGGNGFPDAEVFVPMLRQDGYDIPMPQEWFEERARIKRALTHMAAPYGGKDRNKHWTGEQLRRGGCAVGSQGSLYRMYVVGAVQEFISSNADLITSDAEKERARILIKDMAMIFNGWLCDQTGWHAVTPAADLQNQMAGKALEPDKTFSGLMVGMIKTGKLRELFQNPDFNPWEKDGAWVHQFIMDNALNTHIRSASAADYARDPVPVEGGILPPVAEQLKPLMKTGPSAEATIIGPDAIAFADAMLAKIEKARIANPEIEKQEAVLPYFPTKDEIILMYLSRFNADAPPAAQDEIKKTFERMIMRPEHTYPFDWLTDARFREKACAGDAKAFDLFMTHGAKTFPELVTKAPEEAFRLLGEWQVSPENFTRDWGMDRYSKINRAHERRAEKTLARRKVWNGGTVTAEEQKNTGIAARQRPGIRRAANGSSAATANGAGEPAPGK